MASSGELVYRRLRAPRQDQGLLLDPNWDECQNLVAANQRLLSSYEFDWLGQDVQALRREARRMLERKALEHTRDYLDSNGPLATSEPFIVSGHQPTLFHPGVWAKNFAIDRLASETNGRAFQVIIDNDLMRSHAVVCPAGSYDEPFRTSVPFDVHQAPIPYEMRYVQDRELFATFPQRIADKIRPFVTRPLVQELWPLVVRAIDGGHPIGQAIAQARHQIEHRWGLRAVEVAAE